MNDQPQCVSDGLDARDVLRDLRTMQGIYEKRVLPSTAKMYGDAADVIEQLLAAPPQWSPSPEREVPSFGRILDLAQEGLARWKDRPHNSKWWRKIDGTPIPNDLLVNIAEVIESSLATPSGADVRAAALESALKEILSISNGAIYGIAERALSADTRPDREVGK